MTAPKASASTKAKDDATDRPEVEQVKHVTPAGKVAVVTLGSWPPASALEHIRTQLREATGNEPVILPPGSSVEFQAKAG